MDRRPIEIENIHIGSRNRAPDMAKVKEIAKSISEIGLMNAPAVTFRDGIYASVEAIDRPGQSYIQMHKGEAIRTAFRQAMQSTMAADAAVAMAEMPKEWPSKYRASVAYHLSPILDEVVDS